VLQSQLQYFGATRPHELKHAQAQLSAKALASG
jgi:hypothetical protein